MIAGTLLLAAEIGAAVGGYSYSAASLYLLPLAWTLPFAVRPPLNWNHGM